MMNDNDNVRLCFAGIETPQPRYPLRRADGRLRDAGGADAMAEIPTHVQFNLEKKRKQVEELEARWRVGKL